MQKILSKILSIRPTKGLVSLNKILAFLTNFWPKNENCFLQNQNKFENQHLILKDLTFTKNILHTSTLQIHMRHVCTMYMYCKPTYVIIPVITLLYLLNTRQTTKKVDDNTMIQLYYCWKTLKKIKINPNVFMCNCIIKVIHPKLYKKNVYFRAKMYSFIKSNFSWTLKVR